MINNDNNIKNSFFAALAGIKLAWREERNFKIEVVIAILAIILSVVLDLSINSFATIILTISLVLSVEALNTSLEELCDKFAPDQDPHIKKIKDLAAAAVLISSIAALIVAIIIFGAYL